MQARALERPGGGQVEAHVLDLDLLDLGLGQVDEVADEHRQLAQLRLRGGHDAARSRGGQALAERERVEVGLHARQRRAQLVRGVGDELALGQARALERGEHRVEARGQPPELVLLAGVDAMAEVLRARDAFGGAGQAAHRHERRARDEQPERRGERDAAQAHDRQHELQVGERAVDVGSAAAPPATPRPAGARSVSTRTRVPATVASLKNAPAAALRRRHARRR